MKCAVAVALRTCSGGWKPLPISMTGDVVHFQLRTDVFSLELAWYSPGGGQPGWRAFKSNHETQEELAAKLGPKFLPNTNTDAGPHKRTS